jgi:hypothetical protein
VAVVAVSVVAGARLLAAADDTVAVWVAADDLAAGAPLTAAGLEAHRVRFADESDLAGYFAASAPPPDGVALRGIGAGELVPRAAIGPAEESGTVEVPVSVEPEQVPPSVGAGSVVDVYAVGGTEDSARESRPVLEEVGVVAAPDVAESFVVSGRRQLVLAVPQDEVPRFFGLLATTEAPSLTVVRRS